MAITQSRGGTSGGSLPSWLSLNPDAPPTVADAMDDECTGAALDAKWTIFDPGGITGSVTKSYGNNSWHSFTCPSSVNNRLFAITQPAPAGTWRVRSKLCFDSATWNYFGIGLIARRSSALKSAWAGGMYHSAFGVITSYAAHINEPSTIALDQDLYDFRQDTFYLEQEYDGTNLTWRISKTGAKFTRFWQETTASYLGGAPDQIGIQFQFWGNSSDANHIMTASADWYRRAA